MNDRYNVPIEVESPVAFNWQGQVCRGYVKSVGTAYRYGHKKDKIEVWRIDEQTGQYYNKPSTVTDRLNLVVVPSWV